MELRDPEFSEDFIAYTSINTIINHGLTLLEEQVTSSNFCVLVYTTFFPEFLHPLFLVISHQTLLKYTATIPDQDLSLNSVSE